MSEAIQPTTPGLPDAVARVEAAKAVRAGMPVQKKEAPAKTPEEADKPTGRPPFDAARLRKEIEEAVERLNEQMRQEGRALVFSVDQKSSQTVITVKNSQTGEVVRQIPDETLLKVAHSLEDMKGLLYDAVS